MAINQTPIAQLEKLKFREPSSENIALAVVNPDGSTIAGSTVNSLATVNINAGNAHIGSVSVFGNLSASLGGNVTLNPSDSWVGLVSLASIQGNVQLVSTPTLFAVVNTSAAGIGQSLVTVNNFPSGFNVNSAPTLFAVVNTSVAGTTDVTSSSGVTVFPGANFPVTGTFWQATQPISGAVSQSGNWNVQSVLSLASIYGKVGVTGTVTVDGSGVTQPVSGTVTANQGGSWDVRSLLSLASLYGEVKVTNFPATQPVSLNQLVSLASGTEIRSLATILNFPATQAVSLNQLISLASGTEVRSLATIMNFPASYPVTGTFWQATQPVSIAANINSLATVNNFPTTYPVTDNNGSLTVDWASGATVSVGNIVNSLATVTAGAAFPVTDNSGSLTVDWASGATIAIGAEVVPSALVYGMVSSASGGLVQFAANAVRWASIRAANGNATTVYVGGSLATINNGYFLDPGDTVGVSIDNTNRLYLVGVGTSEVRFIGAN